MSSLRPFAVCLLSVFLVSTAKSQPGCLITPIASTLIHFRPVVGAPLSADIVKEQTRLSKDGSEQIQVSHGKIYRDGEGRSRCEIEDAKGEITVIEIVDSVANLYIRLLTRDKVARVTHRPDKAPSTPAGPTPTPEVAHMGFAPHEEDLGTRTIEGFVVTGKRLTKTQEARDAEQASGHVMAVDMMESWFSKDLHLVLLDITDFGHSNKVVNKALNIQAGDPNPQVFHIPGDYTVKDIYCRGARCDYDSPEPGSPQELVKRDQ